jgi:pimeloyl-ACP methyl ester carboxylesterase
MVETTIETAGTIGPSPKSSPRRRSRRNWLLRGGAALLVVLLLVDVFSWRAPAPVGHFTSAAAQDRFLAAYQEAMTDLPPPDRTLDIRTSFGVVRLYHFAGTGPADADATPLLLLPGRAAPSPVWADNLPALRQLRSVYAVDLLGEPGMSIQQRPITSPQDHAQWLHEVLQELPEPAFHVVGLSIGGWTAMNLAVHRPEQVALKPLHGNETQLLGSFIIFKDGSQLAVPVPGSGRGDARGSMRVNGSPSTSSITTYGRLLASRPASSTRAIPGWFIFASTRASARKRAWRLGVVNSLRSTFTATCRC